jgi:exodeoxyribonuclease V alpha subunit
MVNMKTLEALSGSGHINFIDLSLARELLKESITEDAAAVICHLSLAARRGHLCIEINEEGISPDPVLTWNENSSEQDGSIDDIAVQMLLQKVPEMIAKGFEGLPHDLLTNVSFDNEELLAVQTPLCRMGNKLYFQRYWFYETSFLRYYRSFTLKSPNISFDKSYVDNRLRQLEEDSELLPEQANAIRNACENSLTIICGGPGTGKTYTAGKLICILWAGLSEEQHDKFQVALAAPTGKAAANLQKSLVKAAAGVEKLSDLQSKTLHGLLGVRGSGAIGERTQLPFDLVIVDESSMIDVRMMAALFAAMKPGARLVLLGDSHQLPAVEAGSLFADLVNREANSDVNYKVCQLEKCLRAELQGIIDAAAIINSGDVEGALQFFDYDSKHSGINRLKLEGGMQSDAALSKRLSHYAFDHYKMQELARLQPLEILEHFNKFRLLSPLRKGYFGVEEMNRLISQEHKVWLKDNPEASYITPIMMLKNDYRLELFNGEVGVLIRSSLAGKFGDFEFSQGDYALFTGKDGLVKQIPALLLPAFEYAYCLSVHKSQGSEFDHLLLLLPSGSECFGRELLYTAVTRARRQLSLWTNNGTLGSTIRRKTVRLSGVAERQSAQPHIA